jgi:hypothetical protein
MRSQKVSSLTSLDAQRSDVASDASRVSDSHLAQASLGNHPEGEVRELVGLILNEIARYEGDSLDYRVFVPLEPEHRLRKLVSRLQGFDPNAFKSGSCGRPLWRRVVRASVMPPHEDYLKVFDELEAFEYWLIQQYRLGPTKSDVDEEVRKSQPQEVPFSDLNVTEYQVLEAIDAEPRRGDEISDRAGYSHDTVRHILPRLVKSGYVHKTKRGYVRLCSLPKHRASTSAAQTDHQSSATIEHRA